MKFYEKNPAYFSRLMLADDRGRRVTYQDFWDFYETTEMLSGGTFCFLFCENTIGAVFFYLACLNRRVVPLLLDKNMDNALRDNLIRTYEPQYLIFPDDMAQKCQDADSEVLTAWDYHVLKRENIPPAALNEELALLLTTSGSTGSPKLVRQSWKNISSNAAAIADYLKLTSTERPITTLPMNYTYGLSIINSHLQAGAAILLTTCTMFEQKFWDFFKEAGATSFGGVPYTYTILRRLSFFNMELPSLRTMTQAGGKLPEGLHRQFAEYARRTGRQFFVMYGQTEATARMGYLPPEKSLEKCGSMGIAIPGGRFHLMDDAHQEIETVDTVGELVYEGPNVTLGYAVCREDLGKDDENKGILFTGDMASRDLDGYYYIKGRKKRFLKIYGKRVNMDEIEQMIRTEYEDVEAACIGEDDQMRIYLAGKPQAFCETAANWLSVKTGIHPRNLQVRTIDAIPKNAAGKTQYGELETNK